MQEFEFVNILYWIEIKPVQMHFFVKLYSGAGVMRNWSTEHTALAKWETDVANVSS